MNSDQNLARTGRWARHILEEDDLRTSEHVDAIGFIVTVMSVSCMRCGSSQQHSTRLVESHLADQCAG
jgi:hypothetical protein